MFFKNLFLILIFIKFKYFHVEILGNGKSSLCNFILGKQAFSISNRPESETKITQGERGINDKNGIFIIDTPGLQDSKDEDKEHIIQMIDYIKEHPELQAILIVFNFHQSKLPSYVSSMIKLLCNIFPGSNIWDHVALVWTKCYFYIPPEEKKKRVNINNMRFMPKVMELVKETNGGKPIKDLPTFFIDSDFKRQDPSSIEEAKRLIKWAHSLSPIDITKIKAADPKIKETVEEKEVREKKRVKGNIEYIKLEYYKRNKNIHYDGRVTFSNWEKVKEENKEKVLPKEILGKKIDKKEEKEVKREPILYWRHENGPFGGIFGGGGSYQVHTGYFETTTTIYYEKTIITYNDGSVDNGEWKEVDRKSITLRINK